jgi:hypothetical protein
MKKEILSISRINVQRIHQKIYRNLGTKNTDARDPPSTTKVEPYWKSLWVEKAQCNERAEWIRRKERKKIK